MYVCLSSMSFFAHACVCAFRHALTSSLHFYAQCICVYMNIVECVNGMSMLYMCLLYVLMHQLELRICECKCECVCVCVSVSMSACVCVNVCRILSVRV